MSMADGGIIFEVGMDVSQLEQDAGQALSNLKRFASKGASIISGFSKALGGNGKEFGYGILESISNIESKATSLIEKAINIGAVFTDNERDTALFNNELLSLTEKLENYIKLYDELKSSDGVFNPDTKEINYLSDDDRKKLSDYSLKITELTSKIAKLNAERAKVIAISNITDDDKQRIIEYANSIDELTLAENRLKKAQDALPELKLQYGEDSSEFINAALNMQKAQARVDKLKEDISRQSSIESGMKDAEKEANLINKKTLAMREYEVALRRLSEIRLDKGSESVEFAKQALQVQKLRTEIEKLANAEAMSTYNSTMSEIGVVTRSAVKGITALWDSVTTKQVKSIKDIEPAANKYGESLVKLSSVAGSSKDNLLKYGEALETISQQINEARLKGNEEAVAALTAKYNELSEAARNSANEMNFNSGETYSDEMSKLDQIKASISRTKAMLIDAFQNTKVGAVLVPVAEAIKNAVSFIGKSLSTIKDVGKKAFDAIKNGAQKAAVVVSWLTKALTPIVKILGKIGSVAGKALGKILLSPLKTLIKPLQKVTSLFDRIKGILTRVVIMKTFRAIMQSVTKVIQEQTEALYRWGQANKTGIGKQLVDTMDKLYTKLNYLKNSVAALFSSFITTFGPQVINLINKLIPVINKVNATIAAAFGQKKFLKAVEIPMSYADSLDKSNKKAKELKRSLMGFDALNRLDGDTDSSDEVDYSKMFKEASVAEEGVLSLENVLKKFFALPLDKWGEALGKKFSDKVNSIIETVRKIPFEQVGSNIATFFNGLINTIDGSKVGEMVGLIMKSVVDSITGFVKTLNASGFAEDIAGFFIGILSVLEEIDLDKTIGTLISKFLDFMKTFSDELINNDFFTRLGVMIGEAINAGIKSLNSEDIIGTLKNIINGIFDFVLGIFKTVDTTQIVELILNVANTVLSTISKRLGEIDWAAVGNSAASTLAQLLSDPEFVNNISDAISTLILVLLDFACGLLEDPNNLLKICEAIVKTVEGIDWGSIFTSALTLLENAFWTILPSIIGILFEGFVGVGGNIVSGLLEGLSNKFGGIFTWLYKKVNEIIEKVQGWLGIHSPSTVFSEMGTNIVLGLLNGLKSVWSKITSFFSEEIEKLKKTAKEKFEGVRDTIREVFNGMLSGIEKFVNGIIRGVNKIITALNGLQIDIPNWAEKISGVSSIGFNIPTISEVKIPRLATGAVLPANNPFLAVVGDQKHGTNVEAPLSTIEQAVENVVDRKLRALRIEPAPVIINGREVAKVVFQEHNDTVTRTGKTPLRGV